MQPEFYSNTKAINIVKEEGTHVSYFIFDEYEIHYNTIPSGTMQKWHRHEQIEEILCITKGSLTCLWLNNDIEMKKIIKEKEFVHVKKSIHTFYNHTAKDTECIVFRLVLDGNDKRELIKNDKIVYQI